ncbi:hypothetical protein IW262DRAFT_1505773 [Armillaria fumosa]|nr:hypothetical protein IW262DRAFT_1505773 [Armillaria fumosa]
MPFSVTVVPRTDAPSTKPGPPPYGDIFSVFESLTHPFHQLCMTALETATVRTTPACRRIVTSICSSRLSKKGAPRGKARPGILCRPPPQTNGQPGPWLFLMGTFDGHDESTLPEVYKEFTVIVATGPIQEGDEDQFYVRTVPEWQTSDPEKTQWCIALPLTSRTGVIPTDRWICFGPPDVPFTVEPVQLKKLTDYSRARLRDFFKKLSNERDYLQKVALELQNEEIKYRRKKQASYAASKRTVHSNVQQLEQAMKSVRLNDSTNTKTGSTSKSRAINDPSSRNNSAPSVSSKLSARVLL